MAQEILGGEREWLMAHMGKRYGNSRLSPRPWTWPLTTRLAPALALALILAAPLAEARATARATAGQPERQQLEALQRRIEEARKRRQDLQEERQALQREAARISGELVRMAAKMQALEQRLSEAERRIAELERKRGELLSRLLANREVMARLLAALQRLRRDPPPPFVTSPDDVLKAVRGALMMGAVLPGLDARARRLKDDLESLARLRERLRSAREERQRDLLRLRETAGRMQGMLRLKQDLLARTRRQLAQQSERLARLMRQASTLEELLSALERERRQRVQEPSPQEKRTGPGTAKGGQPPGQAQGAETSDPPTPQASPEQPAPPPRRLALAPFASLRNRLPWPAQGRKLAGFGQRTELLGKARGIYLATRPHAVVTAPVNARVEMAGPFRTYGKLVILDVGGGYRILLAGLAGLNVKTGDWVRAGEPLGRMGERPAPATIIGKRIEPGRPILYMEIRQHNRLRDPAQWFVRSRRQAYRQ